MLWRVPESQFKCEPNDAEELKQFFQTSIIGWCKAGSISTEMALEGIKRAAQGLGSQVLDPITPETKAAVETLCNRIQDDCKASPLKQDTTNDITRRMVVDAVKKKTDFVDVLVAELVVVDEVELGAFVKLRNS